MAPALLLLGTHFMGKNLLMNPWEEHNMRNYRFDHVHLRSSDPEATARFFETMFGAEVTRGVYPPGTLYAGQPRLSFRVGGQRLLIGRASCRERVCLLV